MSEEGSEGVNVTKGVREELSQCRSECNERIEGKSESIGG